MKFGDTEIEKPKLHQHKTPFSIIHVDITKIVLSNKVPFGIKGFKYFIGNKDDKKVRPLCIMVVMYIDIFVLSFLNLES